MRSIGENLYLRYTLETSRPVVLVVETKGVPRPRKGGTDPTFKDKQYIGKLKLLTALLIWSPFYL